MKMDKETQNWKQLLRIIGQKYSQTLISQVQMGISGFLEQLMFATGSYFTTMSSITSEWFK